MDEVNNNNTDFFNITDNYVRLVAREIEDEHKRSTIFDGLSPEIYLVFYWIQSCLSVLGNGATITVFTKYRKMRTPSNVLVLFLATGRWHFS